MPNDMSHEAISERFVNMSVVDFEAMGKFIAELGPELAVSDSGWHGVSIGRFNVLACHMPAAEVTRLIGDLNTHALTAAVIKGALGSSLPN